MGTVVGKPDGQEQSELSATAAAAAKAAAEVGGSHITFEEPPTDDAKGSSSLVVSKTGTGSGGDTQSNNVLSSFRSTRTELVTAKYFKDHYSLLVPSSSVRFRGNTRESFESHGCHVIENENHQIILEERLHVQQSQGGNVAPKRTISIKRVRSTTKGLQMLRALYTIVCVLFVGIFLAFAVQLILNLVLDLAVISGDTSLDSKPKWYHAPPLLLGLVQLCVTFAEGMVIATRFVMDAWSGHYLVKEFFPKPPGMKKNLVCVEWLFFIFLLGIPLVVMIVTLFAGLDNCWVITGVTWYASVGLFYVAFAGYTVFYEVRGAINFVLSHTYPERRGSLVFRRDTFLQACKRCILMRQVRRYSGKKKATYFAKTIVDQEDDDDNSTKHPHSHDKILGEDETDIVEGSYHEKMNLWSMISMSTMLTDKLRLFHRLDAPKQLYNVDDAQGLRPFVTKWTWSLERVYCNPHSRRYVAIIDGPGAVTRNQVLSSLSCSILGTVLIALLITSFLVWFGLTWWIILFMLVLLTIVVYLNVQRVRKTVSIIFKLNKSKKEFQADDKLTAWFFGTNSEPSSLVKLKDEDIENPEKEESKLEDIDDTGNDGKERPAHTPTETVERRHQLQKDASTYIEGPSIGLYIVGKSMRVTEASETVCWFMMFCEISLFYIWPTLVLFLLETSYVGTIYMIGVGISGIRHYFNIIAVIEETGTMKLVVPGKSRSETWRKQSRLTDIVDKISTDKSKRIWLAILSVFGFIFVALFVGGVLNESNGDTGDTTTLTFLPEWYYPPQRDNAQYPSCVFGKPPSPPLSNYSLADMAFLSSLSYRSTTVIDNQLKGWFGPSGRNVTDEFDYVSNWKDSAGPGSKSAVFRLFRFSGENGATGIVSVRGTASPLDLLVDNQLWQAAMLAQLVRLSLPFGEIFTPILPTLVYSINALQSQAVQRVSYYKTITSFVNDLKDNSEYNGTALTGHSLGGGIAIISAAQTGVGAVAISGPNAMLSRLSFQPQLTVESLNTKTFNVIPRRDWVPRFDDKAMNYQNIECRSDSRNPLSCHSIIRTVCELIYTCGTGSRPAICECVKSFKFPRPVTDGDQDFDEMCVNARSDLS